MPRRPNISVVPWRCCGTPRTGSARRTPSPTSATSSPPRTGTTTRSATTSKALELFRTIGDRTGEADALNGLAAALAAAGNPDQARRRHSDAFTVAMQTDDRYEQARAHSGLGQLDLSASRPDLARQHWRLAVALYAELGVPDATELDGRLSKLDG
jgi:tetratricopeptide (TPR) repeat protein